MTTLHLVPADIRQLYDVREWRNACAVLKEGHPEEWNDILVVLHSFRLLRSHINEPGGRKSPVAVKLDSHFYSLGWVEKSFDTKITVDGIPYASPTHSGDCFKGKVALEVEWNNKDPFYDCALNNFRLLFELRVIDVGVMITRSSELQTLFNELGKGKSYGQSTTHLRRLDPRIEGGGGGGCPILVFGITRALYLNA